MMKNKPIKLKVRMKKTMRKAKKTYDYEKEKQEIDYLPLKVF